MPFFAQEPARGAQHLGGGPVAGAQHLAKGGLGAVVPVPGIVKRLDLGGAFVALRGP